MKRNLPNSDQTSESLAPNFLDPDASSIFPAPSNANVNPPTATSRRTTKSTGSNKSRQATPSGNSAGSTPTMSSKYRNIQEWNEKSSSGISQGDLSSASFEAQRHASDPPRPPKTGLEWVWFPEGYWAERQVSSAPTSQRRISISPNSPGSRSRRSTSRQSSFPRESTPSRQKWWDRSTAKPKESSINAEGVEKHAAIQKTNVPMIKIGSVVSRPSARSAASDGGKRSRNGSKVESSDVSNLGEDRSMRSETDVSTLNKQPATIGLLLRTKKQIQKRLLMATSTTKAHRTEGGTLVASGDVGLASRTATLLEGATNYFNQQYRGNTGGTTPSSPEARSRRVFGLAPWQSKNSHESLLSVSSSVHQLLMGEAPSSTPEPERKYAGHEVKSYFRVGISSPDPHGTTFLPSEAKRINTPPLAPGTPGVGARGFFFDINAAQNPASRTTSPGTSGGSGSVIGRVKSPPVAREWWERDVKYVSVSCIATEKQTNRGPLAPLSSFELSLPPEHLPNSPLCPRNTLHPSRGTGICPFHGRKKNVKLKAISTTDTTGTSSSGKSKSIRASQSGVSQT